MNEEKTNLTLIQLGARLQHFRNYMEMLPFNDYAAEKLVDEFDKLFEMVLFIDI
jgi:hypothetical protein